MENAVVTFKDKNTGKFITIDLQYDKENSTVDYDWKLSADYKPSDSMDFIGFLAQMFIRSLEVDNAEQ